MSLKVASLFNYPFKEDIYNMSGGSFLPSFGWVGWETARLPREKEPGETPQGVKTTEEACRFPRRKASSFPSYP
ncbi:hypothetical protein GCM10007216_17670 [Thalassobacillus devorans]|uniref:Uncharacterized protein n=1 Tax=Thalassobacillus devorans TaxID=279813 RepID=A0ABQ1NY10_9BACI|nr:hypothetical protein GCM10007216_17670 [Thalassobacillus devorans]